jgi:hypothetical protein
MFIRRTNDYFSSHLHSADVDNKDDSAILCETDEKE